MCVMILKDFLIIRIKFGKEDDIIIFIGANMFQSMLCLFTKSLTVN